MWEAGAVWFSFFLLIIGSTVGRNIEETGPNTQFGSNGTLGEPSEDDIHFWLFTRGNGLDHPKEIELNLLSLAASGFNPLNPTRIIIHGFTCEGISFGRPFAEAYLEVGDYNVISVDWERLAEWTDYFGAAVRTKFVGEHTAKLVEMIANFEFGGIHHLHVIGHSLGAHTAGFLGKKLIADGYNTLQRITGLDPAQPAFDLAGPNGRLDKGDAELVDIIHTNSGMLWEGCLSILKGIGHRDFYPAGGRHQPGCIDICIGEVCSEDNINDLIRGGCSHGRSHEYFVESIRAEAGGQPFSALLCETWDQFSAGDCCSSNVVTMGHGMNEQGEEGKYMLMVGDTAPFAMEDQGFCSTSTV